MLGGAIIFWLPITPITDIIRAGLGAAGGILLGLIILLTGLFMWFGPGQRKLAGVAAIVAGLIAYPVTNLGGFGIGMLYAIVGGCLALSWTPDKPRRGEHRANPSLEQAGKEQSA